MEGEECGGLADAEEGGCCSEEGISNLLREENGRAYRRIGSMMPKRMRGNVGRQEYFIVAEGEVTCWCELVEPVWVHWEV